jgi:CHAD domain-containing protein
LAARLFSAGNRATAANASRESMHQFRIQAKRFRYTLELFRPVYGKELSDLLDELRALQDKLGRLNDFETTHELVQNHAVAAAAMESGAVRCETEFRAHWKRLFDPTARKRWKSWLAGDAGAEALKKIPHADLHTQARRGRVA